MVVAKLLKTLAQDRLIALETLTYLNILNNGLKIQSTSGNCALLNEERKIVEGLYEMEFFLQFVCYCKQKKSLISEKLMQNLPIILSRVLSRTSLESITVRLNLSAIISASSRADCE